MNVEGKLFQETVQNRKETTTKTVEQYTISKLDYEMNTNVYGSFFKYQIALQPAKSSLDI